MDFMCTHLTLNSPAKYYFVSFVCAFAIVQRKLVKIKSHYKESYLTRTVSANQQFLYKFIYVTDTSLHKALLARSTFSVYHEILNCHARAACRGRGCRGWIHKPAEVI